MKANFNDLNQNTSLELLAHQLVEGFITGLHKSPYHGFSVEFAEHRLYNEGESTRHIDWKVYARTDRLFTKRYEEETNLRCLIAIDTSASMFYPAESRQKIRFSKYAAAALCYLLNRQRDAVGLCLFSDVIQSITPVKSSPTHLNKLLRTLDQIDQISPKQSKTQIAKVLHEVAESIHKRSLVIIFSDMFDSTEATDDLFKALQHLKHNKHEVIVFHVMDNKTELLFDFQDRPMEFIDLESGERVKLNPGDIKKSYQIEALNFHRSLKMRCNQFKIDFIEADVSTDFNVILQTYLIKRAKMR
ncbi:DUF58 domain-containing protein [Pseudochryseolinea flava]|uniref:DUF58 domain-containing protein n=1 Tax=Pseudochryseolinea flava TaxID=2059302 RepID=A0A364XYY6_9BACT|nr:DUF58 domain-containing protein [Pseudochryseolinea flava]RAV99572.1 DUF58 domain-containing protein [Pseudochryseolinea flava]